jgi:hypothetical protein
MKFSGDFLRKNATNDVFESVIVNIRDSDSENVCSSSEDEDNTEFVLRYSYWVYNIYNDFSHYFLYNVVSVTFNASDGSKRNKSSDTEACTRMLTNPPFHMIPYIMNRC